MWYRLAPIILLIFSNLFMTYAWYGHLKDLKHKPLLMAIYLVGVWRSLNIVFKCLLIVLDFNF